MVEGLASIWRRTPSRYRLEGVQCKTCSTNYFPPRVMCPKCRRKGILEPKIINGDGKIFSFTTLSAAPTGFSLDTPYVIGIIELDDGPKITAQIVETEGKELKIGSKVEVVFRKLKEENEEGLLHYGYKFRLVL